MKTPQCISPVTDAMVERAWAAIVGRDIAPQCFNASIIRGDLRTALEAVIGPAQVPSKIDEWDLAKFMCVVLALENWDEVSRTKYLKDAAAINKFLSGGPAQSGVMRSAEKAAETVASWSPSKQAYAARVTGAGPAQPSASPDPEAWMRDDGSAATINPMIAAGWKAQGGRAIPLYAAPQAASVTQTATREALEEINALISNGDRPTVNERNAFEHFTALNRLLLNIRDIARRALSSVPSTDSAPIPTENDIRHAISSALELNGLTYDGVSQAARAVLALSSKLRGGE